MEISTYKSAKDTSFRIPKYIQLKQIIKDAIHKKGLKPGDRLPSERELMNKYKLNQVTIAQALRELVVEGVVDRVQGSGSFVAIPKSQEVGNIFGVVIPDLADYVLYSEIVRAIEDKGREYGYHMIVCSSDYEIDKEVTLIRQFVAKVKIKGLISRPNEKGGIGKRLYSSLKNLGLPIVWILGHLEGIGDVSCVKGDDIWGGYIATKHLLELGHRRIVFIGFNKNNTILQQRFLGAKKAFKERGKVIDNNLVKEVTIIKGRMLCGVTNTKEITKQLLRLSDTPTAFFVQGDLVARDILVAIKEEGLKVPNEISIIGYDDTIVARALDIPLTSVAPPKAEIGRKAVELLMDQIEGKRKAFSRIELKPKLVIRESTAIPKKTAKICQSI